jgi:hypothetical protein
VRSCWSVAVALLIVACASIDAPATVVPAEAGTETPLTDAGPIDRCRVLDRSFVTSARARIYGDAPAPQAVCVTLETAVPGGGTGAILFCVAGKLANVTVPDVRDLKADLTTCAYCTDIQTNCSSADAGLTCTTSYAPLTGKARIVRLGNAPGEPVWIDLGFVAARVVHRDATRIDVERLDCLLADGLTIQGTLERGSTSSCSGVEQTACTIADSAASRVP